MADKIYEHNKLVFIKRLKLPKIDAAAFEKAFQSKKKGVSPFDRFHFWGAKKMGGLPKDSTIRVGAFWICEEDAKILEDYVREWIKKYNFPHFNKASVDKALAWHNLDIGPATFRRGDDRPEWARPGYCWVMEPVFMERKEA
jgi:hypothetical protein